MQHSQQGLGREGAEHTHLPGKNQEGRKSDSALEGVGGLLGVCTQ